MWIATIDEGCLNIAAVGERGADIVLPAVSRNSDDLLGS